MRLPIKAGLWHVQCGVDAVAFIEEAQHGLQPGIDVPIKAQGSCVLASSSADNTAKHARVGLQAD